MAEFIKTQSSFANGEVAPEFFARDELSALSRLQNMDVVAGGGLRRRRGLVHVANLTAAGRLVPFSAGEDEDYVLLLKDGHLVMYNTDGRVVRDILSPWGADALPRIQCAQRFGTMIFVHPDYAPQTLSREDGIFRLVQFDFERDDSSLNVRMPFMKFDDASDIKMTITRSQSSNAATLTTDADFWVPESVGGRLQVAGTQWLVDQYVSPTSVVAIPSGSYTLPSGATADWQEAAFSPRRGWPCSITFHQDRLVFGGSRSWAGGVWMSQVGRHRNFDIGTGLDDEAIFITLLSQRRQQICTVVSSENLQIMTTDGEWAISNKPLTPAAVDIRQHTSVGSVAARYLPPQKIEGQTVFISKNKTDIRELILDELGEKYSATDLCALSKHLMTNPVDIAYNEKDRQLFVVQSDGTMAVLNQNAALGISAWGRYITDGQFCAVAVCAGETFVVVVRGDNVSLEKFSDDALDDAGEHDFEIYAAAMPLRGSGHNGRRVRIRRVSARVLDTKSLHINGMRALLPNAVYEDRAAGYSGDVSVSLLGTGDDTIHVPWTIHGTDAMPVQILSVTMHGRYII